jgi:hypothetical protein
MTDTWTISHEPVSPDDPIVHGRRWREERDRALNYLRTIRACCGYTVPGAEFDVERDELEGVMRVVDEYLRALDQKDAD